MAPDKGAKDYAIVAMAPKRGAGYGARKGRRLTQNMYVCNGPWPALQASRTTGQRQRTDRSAYRSEPLAPPPQDTLHEERSKHPHNAYISPRTCAIVPRAPGTEVLLHRRYVQPWPVSCDPLGSRADAWLATTGGGRTCAPVEAPRCDATAPARRGGRPSVPLGTISRGGSVMRRTRILLGRAVPGPID